MGDPVTPAAWVRSLLIGQGSAVGRVRSANEDSVRCEPVDSPNVVRRGLFCAVADGMGGHAAGDVASDLAVRTARQVYYSAQVDAPDEALRAAIESANSAVFEAGAGKAGRAQMGSTLTAVVLLGHDAVVGHVGDSRLYRIGSGRIEQLTRDHSWVADEVAAGALTAEEARTHPRRNIITRALGLQAMVEVDVFQTTIPARGCLLLCSDGLYGPVRDEEIQAYAEGMPPQQAVDGLIALANERGGPDNISVVIVAMADGPEASTAPIVVAAEDSAAATQRLDTRSAATPAGDSMMATPGSVVQSPPPVPELVPGDGEASTRGMDRADARATRNAVSRSTTGKTRGQPMAVPIGMAERAATIPTGADQRPPRTPGGARRGALVSAGLLGLVLLGGAVGWLLWGSSRPSEPPQSVPTPAPVATVAATTPAGAAVVAVAPVVAVPTAAATAALPPSTSVVPPPTAVPVQAAPATATPAPAARPPVLSTVIPLTRRRELEIVRPDAAVRAAPVPDGPVIGRMEEGDRLSSEADVNGAPIDGSTRWYLVTDPRGTMPNRGFVHSSVVRELP